MVQVGVQNAAVFDSRASTRVCALEAAGTNKPHSNTGLSLWPRANFLCLFVFFRVVGRHPLSSGRPSKRRDGCGRR